MPTPIDFTLLTRYLSDTCSPEEQQLVKAWLQASPENQQYVEQLRQVWQASGELPLEPDPDTDQAWLVLRDKMEKIRPLYPAAPLPRIRTLHTWIPRVAAVLLLTIGLSFLSYWFLGGPSTGATSLVEIRTGQQPKRVVLADGSQVWLNRNSSIRYPKSFQHTDFREIKLTGEAYFEVKKDPSKPFLVHTGALVTKVLGTAFVLQAYQADSTISLQVASGKVAFYQEGFPERGLQLLANQQAVFSKPRTHLEKSQLTDPNFLSWKTGKLTFRNTPLWQVVRSLKRHYGQTVELANTQLANCQLTAEFTNQSLPEVLETLQLTHQVQYREKAGKIVLAGEGCSAGNQP